MKKLIILVFTFYSSAFTQININYLHTSVPDFRVSNGITGSNMHGNPYVDSDSSGNFTAVWMDSRSGASYFYAQVFDNVGTPISNNIIVNENNPLSYEGIKPSIAVNDEGNFMITWKDNNNIYISNFDNRGNKIKEIIFNDTPDHNFSDPQALVDGLSNFVVCFTAFERVYIQKFDAIGNKIGGLIKLQNSDDPWDYYSTSYLASDNEGNFYFTWCYSNEIFLQRFSNDGNKIGELILINDKFGYYISPKIIINDDKSFIVSWGTRDSLWVTGFSSNCSIKKSALTINENPVDYNYPRGGNYSIGCDRMGNYMLTWGTSGQKLNKNFEMIGANFETIEDIPISQSLSKSKDGSFVIIYNYNNKKIYGQLLNSDGSKQGAKFIVNDDTATSPEYSPTISIANSGDFIISWIDTRNNFDELFYQSYNANGEKILENHSAGTESNHRIPLKSISFNNNFLLLYKSKPSLNFSGYNIKENSIIDSFYINHRFSNDFSVNKGFNNYFLICSISSINEEHKLSFYKYSYEGVQIGEKTEITRYASSIEKPSISSNENGEFFVTWIERLWNYYDAIFAQRLDIDANFVNIPFRILTVNTENISYKKQITSQKVVFDNLGRFYLAWLLNDLDFTPNIFLSEYSSDNQLLNTVNVCPSGEPIPKQELKMPVDENGKFVLVWEDSRKGDTDIYAQLFSSDSLRIGNNFKISNYSDAKKTNPSIVFRNGKIYSTWIDYRSEERGIDIWANIIDAHDVNSSIEKRNNIPEKFSLFQNYPNPFNPDTQITYSIPTTERVLLKIYDVLGCEVVTLVNQEQLPGSYKVIFNAVGLSSGIYYYQIKASNFSDTKKMILLQ